MWKIEKDMVISLLFAYFQKCKKTPVVMKTQIAHIFLADVGLSVSTYAYAQFHGNLKRNINIIFFIAKRSKLF